MLREYQKSAIDDILESFNKNDSVMLQMPTGTGKTTVFAELVRLWIKTIQPNKRVLILVHRKELVDQVLERLKVFGILAARIQSGYQTDLIKQVQVGMVQSLKNPKRLPKNISLIVIDEAHHTPALSYRNIIENYEIQSVKTLGVTATPCRTNGEGFSDLFQKLIISDSIKEFINCGFLAQIVHKSFSKLDLSKVKVKKNTHDYDERELDAIVRDNRVIIDLVESYFKYAFGKKTIVFALNKAHSIDIVRRFNDKGVTATYIDSDTDKITRNQIVNDFKDGKYNVLCNVNIFTEGFDCPDIEAVQLARPTKSYSLYLQQVGRVMRPFEGKEHGLILDNAGLYYEHGLVTKDVEWSLESGLEFTEIISNKESELFENGSTRLPDEFQGIDLENVDTTILEKELIDKSKHEIQECILSNEELVFLFQDQIRLVKDFQGNFDLISTNTIPLYNTYTFANCTIFPINTEISAKLFYVLGFINNINQKTINLEKLYRKVDSIINIDQYDFHKEMIYIEAYKYFKFLATSTNGNKVNPREYIRSNFKVRVANKNVRNTFFEKIYNFLHEENGEIKKSAYIAINEYSKTRYDVYSSIINKLNLRAYNYEECLIFGN